MRKQTITKFIGHLQGVIESGLTRTAYAITKELSSTYFPVTFTKVIKDFEDSKVSTNDFNIVVDLMIQIDSSYIKYKNTSLLEKTDEEEKTVAVLSKVDKFLSDSEQDFSDEEPDDSINSIDFERNAEGKIKFYKFRVLIRDKEPLTGKLSRDEMNMIYRMYSYYGMSITQREVSRYFPEYSLIDFKRILRVFNITKASSPFAPHVIEEHSTEELSQMNIREKENDFLRQVEQQRIKNNETLLKKYALENADLQKKMFEVSTVLDGFEFPENVPSVERTHTNNSKKTLFLWLSDMHIGASVDESSPYGNTYNEFEVGCRMQTIIDTIKSLGEFNDIIVCNLGDSLDGMDRQTTRRDHFLPQNMTNKEQVHSYLRIMETLFLQLKGLTNNLHYYCVGTSNHDGDYGWLANVALVGLLEKQGIAVAKVFDTFMGHFRYMDTVYILCHGKDSENMKQNFPLTINDKTELKIVDYINFNNLKGNIVFVKGDLHQSATTYSNKFKYKSVGSLFGGSEWCQMNFGNTQAACDYTILDNNNVLDGRIILN